MDERGTAPPTTRVDEAEEPEPTRRTRTTEDDGANTATVVVVGMHKVDILCLFVT